MKDSLGPPTSQETAAFYDGLMDGQHKRGILGKDMRYNALRILQRQSTEKYFVNVVRPYIKPNDAVLDFGCGPGSFLGAAAPLCGAITGVDITKNFILSCQGMIGQLKLQNATAMCINPGKLPFDNDSFDVVLMMDVIHHLEDIATNLKEVMRVLKTNGRVLIFEPNKLNPLITVVHLFDRNEWGLLKLGSPGVYRKVLSPFISIDTISFNGIVIGPESKVYDGISEFLNLKQVKPLMGWLNPKIFITGKKK